MRYREFDNVMCSVNGCDIPSYLKGLCNKHYLRTKRHGNENIVYQIKDVIDRYWYYIEDTSKECWIWNGDSNANDYPLMSVDGKTTILSRWAYKYFFHEIPSNLQVDHICENVRCVNPSHLQLLTHNDNCLKRDRKPYQQYICASMPEKFVIEHFEKTYLPIQKKPIRYCKLDGCNKKCHSDGYCMLHGRRYKKYGDPMLTKLRGRFKYLTSEQLIVRAKW